MSELSVGGILLLLFCGGLGIEAGFRLRRRWENPSAVGGSLLVVIFLLNLLFLGMLLAQYRERTTLVHQLADVVAQAFRRSAFFPDLDRRWFRTQLTAVLVSELSDMHPGDNALSDPVETHIHTIFDALTMYTAKMELSEKIEARREPMLQILSQLVSFHYRLRYALRERLPQPIWVLLFTNFVVGSLLVGFSNRAPNRREWVNWTAYLLLGIGLLFVMSDLDDPLNGFLQTPFDNLRELHVAFERDPT
jgi:hypothetical protein